MSKSLKNFITVDVRFIHSAFSLLDTELGTPTKLHRAASTIGVFRSTMEHSHGYGGELARRDQGERDGFRGESLLSSFDSGLHSMQNFFAQVKAMVSERGTSSTQSGTNSYGQDEKDLTAECALTLPPLLLT